MVYLVIKELSRNQENVFVVINCLSKDMTGNVDMFRANAIRVYAKVIDVRHAITVNITIPITITITLCMFLGIYAWYNGAILKTSHC